MTAAMQLVISGERPPVSKTGENYLYLSGPFVCLGASYAGQLGHVDAAAGQLKSDIAKTRNQKLN
jgi:hypothetical protein